MKKTFTGFTIVELLIVIVVIAILATISIVAYTGIQNRTYDTAIQSDLRQLGSQIQQYAVINGSLPDSTALQSMGIKVTKNAYKTTSNSNLLYCRLGDTFGLLAQSKSEAAYKFMYNSGLSPHTTAWTPNSNASLCTSIGIDSAATGYSYTWMHLWNSGWVSWVQ